MSTWAEILSGSAAALNDQNRAIYTNTVLLPYLNIALAELQEVFELNNIPVTNKTSATINVPAGTTSIGFTTTPALPADLVEIQELFESQEGQNAWIPVAKRNYLTPYYLGSTQITMFGVWAWMEQAIKVNAAIVDIDLKLDYIKFLFEPVVIGDINDDNTIINTDTFFIYRVAGLAAEFIGENKTRADTLNAFGVASLDRSLGISVKGQQSIPIRRRPFRAQFKRRRTMI